MAFIKKRECIIQNQWKINTFVILRIVKMVSSKFNLFFIKYYLITNSTGIGLRKNHILRNFHRIF